ncbi:3-ketoacyl-CoA thiolase [bacterium]|nr:3-ketoacyl-CoA thiolase [candidate division CSSED10-310 bacterium]
MKAFRKPVYMAAGYYTVSFGSGRKEFHPKKPRPGLEEYIKEAGEGVIAQLLNPACIDEGIIANFMAARFNKQGNLAAMFPAIHSSLAFKPHTRVEGACGSGGLALYTAMKSILSDLSDVVLAMGVEVQNTVKAIYGADYLAGAGHFRSQRKQGHAYFFPNQFSDRAGAMYEKYGYDLVRRAMAKWYEQAILAARRCPKAQEYHNAMPDPFSVAMIPPHPESFVPHLNVFDCSKVSDGAAGLIVASREGLDRAGIPLDKAVQVVGWGTAVADLTRLPDDLTRLETTERAVKHAYAMAGIGPGQLGLLETHDCFTVTGLQSLEAAGIVGEGEAMDYVLEGRCMLDGTLPVNTSGGLIGYGHYTGGSGVRKGVDLILQLTGAANDSQVNIQSDRPFGMLISMGGNDRTVTAVIARAA